MDSNNVVEGLLGLEPLAWMMSPSERLALLGLLVILKPKRTLEFGCAAGSLTYWLSRYSNEVVTVDYDPKVLTVAKKFPNVTPLCMTTVEAARLIEAEGQRFDLTVIDADHSNRGVQLDLENALRFSNMIILHDTYNPGCQEGMLQALEGRDVYFDLELVPGGLQPDGMWGGLGIVMPRHEKGLKRYVTPRYSPFAYLRWRWILRTCIRFAGKSMHLIPSRIKKAMRRRER